MSDEASIVQAHAVDRALKEDVWTPTHPQRGAESAEFEENKKAMEAAGDGCWVCGITQAEAGAPLEGHHYNVEWSLVGSLDLAKVQKYFPDVTDLTTFLDSEENLIILCAKHHRSPLYGVHMVTMPAWVVQRLQLDGWDLTKGQVTEAELLTPEDTSDYYPLH